MTLEECVVACAGNKELVREFNRLTGFHMGEKRSGLEIAIDDACDYDPEVEAFPAFISFVYEFIWMTVIAKPNDSVILQ